MKTVVLIMFGALLASCASKMTMEPPIEGKGYTADHVRHEDDLLHHDGELLVLNPPSSYVKDARKLGLKVIEVTEMASLGLHLYHMQIDTDHHPLHIRELHAATFPDIVVDVHHYFGVHATTTNKEYTSRAAIKWGQAASSCGQGIKIGMIDSGVVANHKAFSSQNVITQSFILNGQVAGDQEHGTAVASVLVGKQPWGGLIPGATLYAADVFHSNAQGQSRASAKSIAHAIAWMAREKVDIVNISIGGAINIVVEKIVQAASDRGIIIIASVGNDGPFTKKKMYPAAYKGVIGIAAVNRIDQTAKFSSKGDYVEFSAPGVDLWTAVPEGGKAMSGTSFSSPIVAAVVAAAMKNSDLKGVEDVRRYLKSLITNARLQLGWNKYNGWGSISVDAPC